MHYYIIEPVDNCTNIWVLGYDDPVLGHRLFDEYLDLICANCGKVDETAAVRRGVNSFVRVRSHRDAKRDFIGTEDGFFLVSQRFKSVVSDARITGLEMINIPGDRRFLLALPTRVATNFASAGLEVHPAYGITPFRTSGSRLETPDHRCTVCGRHYELCFQPAIAAMRIPPDPFEVFSPDIRMEKQYGEQMLMYISEPIRQILDGAGLNGLEYSEAH